MFIGTTFSCIISSGVLQHIEAFAVLDGSELERNDGVLYEAELYKNTNLLVRRFMLLIDAYIAIVKIHSICLVFIVNKNLS